MGRIIEWFRRREREAFAREYPVAAWVAQFDTPEALQAALARGEGPAP